MTEKPNCGVTNRPILRRCTKKRQGNKNYKPQEKGAVLKT